ncbi:MAG: hypothetical protein KBD63_05000 [Bacteriovoracaceae bacterium]|nr:hypothetical protein [Bacteriovoracaceae bacterium]
MKEDLIIKNDQMQWIDILNPTADEMKEIGLKHNIPHHIIEDSLDSKHLPKYEKRDEYHFVILRAYDEKALHEADTVQELTRKLVILYNDNFLFTIHRVEQSFLQGIKKNFQNKKSDKNEISNILFDLLYSISFSYKIPIEKSLDQLEDLEMGVFGLQGSHKFKIKEGYYLKRKAFVFKRILRLTSDILSLIPHQNRLKLQPLKELLESCYFYADTLTESVNSLLHLHISLSTQKTGEASHRTNEVMRVLTIFSVFLLPLNLVTGIYGMNFKYMPELNMSLGYPMALMIMFCISLVTYLWFRKKGWLK